MRARSPREKEVERLAKRLPYVSESQYSWVNDKIIDWHINCSGKQCWCEKCGQSFQYDSKHEGTCPHCGSVLPLEKNRRRIVRGYDYIQLITTFHGWQVIRYFLVKWDGEKGRKPSIWFQEVIQKWCQPGKPTITRGMSLVMLPYWCNIPYSQFGAMTIKQPSYFYTEWMNLHVYPRIRLLNPYKKSVRKSSDFSIICAEDLIAVIYSIPYFETLYKERKMEELKECMKHTMLFQKYWPSIRIALRHGFKPRFWNDYFEYLKMLKYLRKDMHSPRYVAPNDYDEIHTLILHQFQNKINEANRRRNEREALRRAQYEEEQKRKEAEALKSFDERMSRFRDLLISSNDIRIKPLMTIKEFAEEGKAMQHCVFALGYYKKPDSLILSARSIHGKRIETIEVNLKQGIIIQSRGKCNTVTPSHDEICSMVNSHMDEILSMSHSGTVVAHT